LFQALKVEAIGRFYAQHKIFFYRKILKNSVTQRIPELLRGHYETCTDSRFLGYADKDAKWSD